MPPAAYLDELTARLKVPYRRARLPDGCRGLLVDGAVVLADDLTPEREHWAYCHEVAHLRLGHAAKIPRDDAEEREQESDANRLASELLLPEEDFRPYLFSTLKELKETFPFASHEVLARRRQTFRPGLLTLFDNDRLTSRTAPEGWNVSRLLFPIEQEAIRQLTDCPASKCEVLLERDGLKVEATFVDEGRGVARVILFMEGEEG
jgi:hypothetical protein